MQHTLQFGSKEIHFNLSYSNRKTLGITVTPDMEILVKAPVDVPIEKIIEKVKKRAPWIIGNKVSF